MDGGPAPEGIEKAADPRFPVGTDVILKADHMPGMMNAPATIAGAFQTTAHAVDYEPTDGAAVVEDHKWVVQEELQDVGDQPLEVGDDAVMTADHMPAMKGATATVSQVWTGTVYMVDYQVDGMTMTNHKWVVEDEIQPAN
ncbi:YdhK family protein [Arthrobacter sp. JSM 101049]|uniref:YdhK family protein n=1 Tax=Arthrobacter sp. JSM 101049 TaxID=929097 RepID=UPI0035683B34